MNEDDFELEPVEIHPEQYATNLFGEPAVAEGSFTKASDVPSGAWPDFVQKPSAMAFNIFSLTDAIGARKKRDAWVLYHKALASGMAPEEVFFKLVWQVKTMLIAQKTKTAEEAEMKSFPYGKAKGFLRNFKSGELEKFSGSLVKGYHQARRGEGEIETLVEKALLRL
jgi:hypothetical protein